MDRPTEVEIWNVVLPRGTDVKGTLVGDTKPTVWARPISYRGCTKMVVEKHTLKGAKILEELNDECSAAALAGAVTFCLLTSGSP